MEHIYQNIEGWFDFQDLYSKFIRELPSESKIVEIGVWKGKSVSYLAVEAINSGKNIKIYAVDSWDETPIHPEGYTTFLSNIEPIKHVINVIKKPSLEATKLFEDESLDVVFIDALHDYENVKKDIFAWYPKVKQNGYIAGHDYNEGVKQAVDEIFGFRNIKQTNSSWLFRKN